MREIVYSVRMMNYDWWFDGWHLDMQNRYYTAHIGIACKLFTTNHSTVQTNPSVQYGLVYADIFWHFRISYNSFNKICSTTEITKHLFSPSLLNYIFLLCTAQYINVPYSIYSTNIGQKVNVVFISWLWQF